MFVGNKAIGPLHKQVIIFCQNLKVIINLLWASHVAHQKLAEFSAIPKYYGHITSQFEDDSKGFPTAASKNRIGLKNRPRFFEKSNLIEF